MCSVFVTADPELYSSYTRSIRFAGVSTSLRLERMFWDVLARSAPGCDERPPTDQQTARRAGRSRRRLGNFASFLRVCCCGTCRCRLSASFRRTARSRFARWERAPSKRDSRDRWNAGSPRRVPDSSRGARVCDDASRIGEQNMPRASFIGNRLRVRRGQEATAEASGLPVSIAADLPQAGQCHALQTVRRAGVDLSICRCDAAWTGRVDVRIGARTSDRFARARRARWTGTSCRPAGWSSPTGACSVRWRPSSSSAGYGNRSPMRRCVRMARGQRWHESRAERLSGRATDRPPSRFRYGGDRRPTGGRSLPALTASKVFSTARQGSCSRTRRSPCRPARSRTRYDPRRPPARQHRIVLFHHVAALIRGHCEFVAHSAPKTSSACRCRRSTSDHGRSEGFERSVASEKLWPRRAALVNARKEIQHDWPFFRDRPART